MKFKSALMTQASGSVGGATFAHNQGGMYVRGRGLPTQPNTAAQQVVKAAFAALATAWRSTASAAQRAAWSVYATNSPITGKLGDPLVLSGQQMFNRCNTPRLQAGLPVVLDGPTTYGMADAGDTVFVEFVDDPGISFNVGASDAWAAEDDAALLAFVSRPMSPTVNYFKGPYQLAGTIAGDSTTPPSGLVTVDGPFAYVSGQGAAARWYVSTADGRLSPVNMPSGLVN